MLSIFRNIQVVLMLVSIGALSSAYIAQYGFGLEPCILCLYQRIPYFVAIILGALSFAVKGRWRLLCVLLIGLVYLSGALLAFYHAGVEKGIFTMEQGCGDSAEAADSLEAMRQRLLGKAYVPCDKPQFVFLGLSMAAWNFFFSMLVASYTIQLCLKHYQLRRWERKSDEHQKNR
jgi:disulfide bond formation protein DsbB